MVAINVKHRPFPFPVLVIYVSSKSTHQLYPGDTTKLLTDLLVSLSAFFRYLYSTEQRPDICTIQCMTPTIFRPHKFSQLQEAPMEESPFQTNNLHSLEQHRRRNRFITFRSVIKKEQLGAPAVPLCTILPCQLHSNYSSISPWPALLCSSAVSPPQRFVEHKAHILGFEPVSDSKGEQRLRSPPFLDEKMVEDDMLWLWSLIINAISITKDRHEKLGREGGWLLGEFLISRILQVVAVLR